MAGRWNPSRPVEQNQFRRRNHAPVVMLRINICTATTVKNNLNYSARFVRRLFNRIIVLKNQSKQNTSARTASTPCSAGKYVCTSLFTSAAMITARIASTLLKNSTPPNKPCKKINLHNLNSAIFTASIYSRLKNSNIPLHSNPSSTLQKFITLKISSA